MSIRVTDPLFLLSAQTGMSVSELQAKAAVGNPNVEKPQEALKTGEPIPIVFCRRTTANKGGVLVQPKMTEGSFSNPIVEQVFSADGGSTTIVAARQLMRIKYRLVLGQGSMDQLQIRDCFYGNSRRGTWNQKYNDSAGNWNPGNTIDEHIDQVIEKQPAGYYDSSFQATMSTGDIVRAGSFVYYKRTDGVLQILDYAENSFPAFCGTGGTYDDLTTLSFEIELQDNKTVNIDKTVSVFVRNGLQVTRLLDSVTGASDNYVDLAKYLFTANNRLADDLIDSTALTVAANFVNANSFFFNGQLSKSQNLLDWLQQTSVNFLLRLSNSGGKFGLLPRLPYNTDYTIKTTQVIPEFTFTEEHVVSGGFELEYISLEDREPVCFVVQWRQQPEADFGLVRTVQVRYQGEATSGPFIDIDMSDYCTSEDHAVKAGVYRLAQRKFITHHLRLTVREYSYNSTLVIGDLVRVRLRRETSEGDVEFHDKVYEINRIDKTFTSTIAYDLTHFPLDAQGRSIVARAVDAAAGAGNIINVGRSTFDGDENSSTDTNSIGTLSGGGGTVPPEADTEYEVPTPADVDTPYPAGPISPADPLDESLDTPGSLAFDGTGSQPIVGDNATVAQGDVSCADGRVCFYRVSKTTGARTLKGCVNRPVSGPYTMSITTNDIDHFVIAKAQCKDPSTPSGYAPEVDLGQIGPVEPDVSQYTFVRWTGTKTKTTESHPEENFSIEETTPFRVVSTSVGLRGLYGCAGPLGPQPIEGMSGFTAIGPCDAFRSWRSAVWSVQGVAGGGSLALGGISNNSCGGSSGGAGLTYAAQSTSTATYRIIGRWEFSNDGNTVEVSWDGDRADEEVPSDAVPYGSYSCP